MSSRETFQPRLLHLDAIELGGTADDGELNFIARVTNRINERQRVGHVIEGGTEIMGDLAKPHSPLNVDLPNRIEPYHPTLVVRIEVATSGYQLRLLLPHEGELAIESLEVLPRPSNLRPRAI
jgi:hypothetical protein